MDLAGQNNVKNNNKTWFPQHKKIKANHQEHKQRISSTSVLLLLQGVIEEKQSN